MLLEIANTLKISKKRVGHTYIQPLCPYKGTKSLPINRFFRDVDTMLKKEFPNLLNDIYALIICSFLHICS